MWRAQLWRLSEEEPLERRSTWFKDGVRGAQLQRKVGGDGGERFAWRTAPCGLYLGAQLWEDDE